MVSEPDPGLVKRLAGELRVPPFVAGVFVNRGIRTPDEARTFLDSRLSDLPDPFQMAGMRPAAERLARAIRSGEKVAIFGDYDADGVTSAALLKEFLDITGTPCLVHLPDRVREGYGMNVDAIDRLASSGADLIVTVDCGVSNPEEVAHAGTLGIDVVVTDHHQAPATLPPALAVIDPTQEGCRYPFSGLAGVGVVFNLLIALRGLLRDQGFWKAGQEPDLRNHLDLVALGTVADVAPLQGINRILVRQGIKLMRQTRRQGLLALMKESDLEPERIDARAIAFRLGPRINAAGRLAEAAQGMELLLTPDRRKAADLARTLDKLNEERRSVEQDIVGEALAEIEKSSMWRESRSFVVASERWHPGVIGIAASRLVELSGRPAIVIALDGEKGRGSARGIDALDLMEAFRECASLLSRFGGHRTAGGFSIPAENIEAFRGRFDEFVQSRTVEDDFIPILSIDCCVPVGDLSVDGVETLATLDPFGEANPVPVFSTGRVPLEEWWIVKERHLKVVIGGPGDSVEAIGFGMADQKPPQSARSVDIAYTPRISTWTGAPRVELLIKAVRWY